jgi:hypothetical protein
LSFALIETPPGPNHCLAAENFRRLGHTDAGLYIVIDRIPEVGAEAAIPTAGLDVEGTIAPLDLVESVVEFVAQAHVHSKIGLDSPLILNVSEITDLVQPVHRNSGGHIDGVQLIEGEGVARRIDQRLAGGVVLVKKNFPNLNTRFDSMTASSETPIIQQRIRSRVDTDCRF